MNPIFSEIIISGNLLEAAFLKCINLSISAGWLILAVLLLRLAFRKAPRWICCFLWMLVGLRLLCPISLQSPLSLIPSAETIPGNIMQSPAPAISSGIPAVDAQLNPMISASFAPSPEASANPLQIITYIAARLWLIGILIMLLYLMGSFICLRLKMRTATRLRDNIRQSEFAGSPFILGIFRPQIYVHYNLNGEELAHVLAHEQAHLARRDHLLKPLGFLILSVYWFHPLVWASYLLFCKDIELACDEKVIRSLDDARRKAYSLTLLSCAETKTSHRTEHRSAISACPLAFGELNVKERVLRIKNYRRPAPILVIAAIAVCAVTAFCFLTSPAPQRDNLHTDDQTVPDSPLPNLPDDTNLDTDHDADKTAEPDSAADSGSITESDSASPDSHPILGTAAALSITQEESDAITDAILMYNRSSSTPQDAFSCCSFVLLAKQESSPIQGRSTHNITYYGWALYQEYIVSRQGIQDIGGSHVPMALTFELSNDHHEFLPTQSVPESIYREDPGYVLKECWTPGEGSYYKTDIENYFPPHIQADALNSQKYVLLQKQDCYRQALLTAGLDSEDIDSILTGLLDVICSEPSVSSDVQTYIDAHFIEYRELTYYGNYTLDYSERHPRQDLQGQILLRACEDIRNAILTVTSNSSNSSAGS